MEDLRTLGMLEPGGFRLGYLEGQPIHLKEDWRVCIMGCAGFGKTTTLSAPNILHFLKGSASTLAESVVGLDWKNGELTCTAAPGVKAITGEDPIIFAPLDPACAMRLNVFEDIIRTAQAGEPVVEDARGSMPSSARKLPRLC